jgi:hypothetical protein
MSLANSGRALAILAVLVGATPAAGQSPDTEPTPKDRWVSRVAPYWATSMDGNATVAGVKSDVDVTPCSSAWRPTTGCDHVRTRPRRRGAVLNASTGREMPYSPGLAKPLTRVTTGAPPATRVAHAEI